MGTCQACDGPLSRYDEYRVSCKNGHIWTLPEYADLPDKPSPDRVSGKQPVRLVKAPRVPAWVPGTVLGGAALIIEVLFRLL